MDITLEDLVKYGFAEDPNVFLQTERSRLKSEYDQQLANWQTSVNQARERGASDRLFASLDRQYDRITQRRQNDFDRLEQRYDTLASRVESRLESPVFQRKVMEQKTREVEQQRAEQARQAAAAAEQRRQEAEGMQREQAERQAGRFRARAAGGARQSLRPMLSAARMAPEQTMAPGQTLGTFMPK
jgi:hypothetical protein